MEGNIPLQSNEEIKYIENYEGRYSITSFGRVWSHEKISQITGRIYKAKFLKPFVNHKGYLCVDLVGLKSKKITLHRLTAIHFIPNLQNLPQVNHKDGNKSNNFAGTKGNNYEDGNLEWCVNIYNVRHAAINGLYTHKKYSEFHGVSFNSKINGIHSWRAFTSIDQKYIHIGYFKTEIEAAQAYNDYILEHKLNRPLNNIEGGGILS